MKSGADILVADCGLGNLHSLVAALERVAPDADVRVSSDPDEVMRAKKIALPGDGHFDACAREIRRRGLGEALRLAAEAKPFLGICVGMQILYEASDEGREDGLGILPGRIRKLPAGGGRKIPHMGWNAIRMRRPHPVLAGAEDGARFYFIHSFCAPVGAATVAVAEYGLEMSAVSARGMLSATQFHPEKSGRRGARLLSHFAAPDFAEQCATAARE